MDRKLWKTGFTLKDPPNWQCPTCGQGRLKIKEGTFHEAEVRSSRELRQHQAWEPEWIQYEYACLLTCNNEDCLQIVTSAGRGGVGIDVTFGQEGEPDYEYMDFFTPIIFDPPLRLIDIPDECPVSVSATLEGSFKLFFISPEAALNAARAAIETLMTELGVKKFQVQNGTRRPIGLHARINLLTPKHSHVKDLLVAIKWLGNAGSHAGSAVGVDDVLDAYELVEHVLAELFGSKAKAMKALASKVNRRKGPKGLPKKARR